MNLSAAEIAKLAEVATLRHEGHRYSIMSVIRLSEVEFDLEIKSLRYEGEDYVGSSTAHLPTFLLGMAGRLPEDFPPPHKLWKQDRMRAIALLAT